MKIRQTNEQYALWRSKLGPGLDAFVVSRDPDAVYIDNEMPGYATLVGRPEKSADTPKPKGVNRKRRLKPPPPPKPIPFDEWPWYVKPLAKLAQPEHKGIGDVLKHLIDSGADKLLALLPADAKAKVMEMVRGCGGCEGRRQRFNRMYPLPPA